MPAHKKDPYSVNHLPYPEIVDREGKHWEVIPGMVTTVDHARRIMAVTADASGVARVKRAHALAEIRWPTPPMPQRDPPIDPQIYRAVCEKVRHERLRLAGLDVSAGTMLSMDYPALAASLKIAVEHEDELGYMDGVSIAEKCLLNGDPKKLKTILREAFDASERDRGQRRRTVVARILSDINALLYGYGAQWSEPGPAMPGILGREAEIAENISKIVRTYAVPPEEEEEEEPEEQEMPAGFSQGWKGQKYDHRDDFKLSEFLKNFSQHPEWKDQTEKVQEFFRELDGRPGGFYKHHGEGEASYDLRNFRFEYPDLWLPLRGRLGKRWKPSDMGEEFRYPDRFLSDQMVFGERKRYPGGSLLIDVSGSMSLHVNDVIMMMTYAPAATIAIYSSGGTGEGGHRGHLTVIAKAGRRALNAEISKTLGGNAHDGFCLRWLGKQRPPRYWVSDYGVGGRQGDAVLDCAIQMRKHRIKRLHDLAAVKAHFGERSRAKVSL
jgi:hypothetical protein